MTLMFKPDLDVVKMYHQTKNEVSMTTASEIKTKQTHVTNRMYVHGVHDFASFEDQVCQSREGHNISN